MSLDHRGTVLWVLLFAKHSAFFRWEVLGLLFRHSTYIILRMLTNWEGSFKAKGTIFFFFFFYTRDKLIYIRVCSTYCFYSFALFSSWCYHNHHYCPPAHTNFVLGRAEKKKVMSDTKLILSGSSFITPPQRQSKGTRMKETLSKSILLTVHWQEKERCISPLLLLSLSHEHLNLDRQKNKL